eukprot:6198558-Pleurochrysis_carterae.AAC.1
MHWAAKNHRKLELIQVAAVAAAQVGYHMNLITAFGARARAQLHLQIRQKSIATAKELFRSAGVPYKAHLIMKKDIEPPLLPPTLDKVSAYFASLCYECRPSSTSYLQP